MTGISFIHFSYVVAPPDLLCGDPILIPSRGWLKTQCPGFLLVLQHFTVNIRGLNILSASKSLTITQFFSLSC